MTEERQSKSLRWVLAFILILAIGIAFRLIWLPDMEYKSDERYMFERVMNFGHEPFPWLGIASGVYLRNPGLSVWIFLLMGKLFAVHTPVDLVRGVALLNSAALILLAFFATTVIERARREHWIWATALVAVNPLVVLLQRKIWAQSVLPFFSVLFLWSWWKRSTRVGAFFWGFFGALLGQIHMSGFFYAAAFLLWTALRDRGSIRWRPWLWGSLAGALPLIPWFLHLFGERTPHPIFFGWQEALQLKFWVFWVTDPFGLHLGNALGVHRGNGVLTELGRFLREPLFLGYPTYLMAVCHVLVLAVAAIILFRGIAALASEIAKSPMRTHAPVANTRLAIQSAAFIYGALLTLSTIVIRRYYLLITFPLEETWLATMALPGGSPRFGRRMLALLVICEFLISLGCLQFIHREGGAPEGDYGVSYQTAPGGAP